jgi:4-diphosphocytidyl-2-C-methyl-D-erythritol kinase
MSSVPAPVVLGAPAKLTLSLHIIGVREDGYHLLDAEMVSLDLADSLELRAAAASSVRAVDAATGSAIELGRSEDNLIIRALRLVGRQAAVTVTKRIAPGAGLGGGSADAAAVLRWAELDDLDAAAGLGADVAFCVVGGRARVRGIGERVEALEHRDRTFTLATPPFGCSTAVVYRRFDELGGTSAVDPQASNHLTDAALAVEPRLAEWRDRLGDVAGVVPQLAGSGSTWFVEGAFPGSGRRVVRTIPAGTAPV